MLENIVIIVLDLINYVINIGDYCVYDIVSYCICGSINDVFYGSFYSSFCSCFGKCIWVCSFESFSIVYWFVCNYYIFVWF